MDKDLYSFPLFYVKMPYRIGIVLGGVPKDRHRHFHTMCVILNLANIYAINNCLLQLSLKYMSVSSYTTVFPL